MGLPSAFSKFAVIIGVVAMGVISLFGCVSNTGDNSPVSGSEAGSYTVECSRLLAGAKRYANVSDETVVNLTRSSRNDPLDGDGMADNLDSYTFTALSPGTAYVQIINVMPWQDREGVEDLFRLVVDDGLNITREEVPLVERFELREQGDAAAYQVLAAEPGDAGFLRVMSYWEDFSGRQHKKRSLSVLPVDVTRVFLTCGVADWDGFHGSDPNVLDGTTFSFEATFDDGTTVSASGTNSYPDGYGEFHRGIASFLGLGG